MNDQLPSAFIGSSTEGLDIAREVELQLQRSALSDRIEICVVLLSKVRGRSALGSSVISF
jgi:hypothetical protein